MGFDLGRFEAANLQPRQTRVEVPGLAPFFAEGEEAVWVVRGLTATELHLAMEAGKRQQSVETIVRAISDGGDQAAAIRKAIGLSKDTPGEMAKRLELLVMGSVAPVVDLPAAVKLAEHFPVEFLQITNEVTLLTGRGSELGKAAAASQPIPA